MTLLLVLFPVSSKISVKCFEIWPYCEKAETPAQLILALTNSKWCSGHKMHHSHRFSLLVT